MDNVLQAVKSTQTELRVANYLVLFGPRDLEGIGSRRRNADGSFGEYFTPRTKFTSAYTDTGGVLVDFEHAQDVLSADDVLGRVDWRTAKADERGLFVERLLNRRNRYVQWLEDLIKEGLIANSSEAIASGVVRGRDGEIKAWPLKRDTLTVNPMQPVHLLGDNVIRAAKALQVRLPSIKRLPLDLNQQRMMLELDLMLMEG